MNTEILFNVAILIFGLVILIAGGDFLVKGSSKIALRLRVSPLIIGLTIVAFGTSAPELLVSLNAIFSTNHGAHHDLTMGNIIGSNICNLALVLGATAVFTPIKVNPNTLKIDWPMAMGSSLLLYILVSDGRKLLQRHEGAIFVLLLVGYIAFLISRARRDRAAAKIAAADVEELNEDGKSTYMYWLTDVGLIILGCFGLYFGADWFVEGSKVIFFKLGVSERIIGIMVLAIGTSLPELVTSLVAAAQKNTDLAIGNLMGSNIFNVLSILGITSIIKDISVSDGILEDMITMLGITLVVLPLMLIKRKVGRPQGVILLGIYVYYVFTIFG